MGSRYEDHDFSNPDVPHVNAISVYANPNGDIVIRRLRDFDEEDDAVIYFPVAYAETICAAIRREVDALAQESEAL